MRTHILGIFLCVTTVALGHREGVMAMLKFEDCGGPDRTRICDLYRVKVAL
jgi:hypothetical protein